MKLTFHVDYRTDWGESVYISADIPALGSGDVNSAVKLSISGSEHWSLSIDIPDEIKSFKYSYIVRAENGDIKREWGQPHEFLAAATPCHCEIYDRWQDQPWDKPYYSSAFTE